MSTKKIRFIDLFAGIGGFHIALTQLWAQCVFASEWDEHARKTYEKNFLLSDPELFESGNFQGDITKVLPKNIPAFDILCGGFPCQPFSQAGFKKGFSETRGTLFFNIIEIIREKQPAAFFLENVRHLLKHDNGNTFAIIKRTLEELGYSFHYKIVKASDFWLPQHRPRLFMIWFKDPSIKFSFPDPLELKKTMSDVWGWHCDKKIWFTLRVWWRWSSILDRRNWDSYRVDWVVKRLTSKEWKLMQGFPEDFVFPWSEAQALKQLWNSVAVPAIKAVANQILLSLNHASS